MRVLIVDDEAPARARLRRLLEAIEGIQIVGEAGDAAQALGQVERLEPDVLFLDIQMPGQNGFAVAASLPDPGPALVFVTAHDQYALQAFDVAAVDYLLKPVEPERLFRALQRLRIGGKVNRQVPGAPPSQLIIPDRGRTHVLAVADVSWLEAADNYVVVHTAQQAPLMRRTLGGLLTDLGDGFVRTHRGAAVALAHVQSVQSRGKGDCWVTIRGGATVPCSRQYRVALMNRLRTYS